MTFCMVIHNVRLEIQPIFTEYHVTRNVLGAEGGDRACSVEQNKDRTLTELILCVCGKLSH